MEPPLPLDKPPRPTGQFRHDALGVEIHGQHVAVIAVTGDHLIPVLLGHLHADNHGFLTNVQVAEAPYQTHAVELAGLFLKPADEQHLAVGVELLILVELGDHRSRFFGCSTGPGSAF